MFSCLKKLSRCALLGSLIPLTAVAQDARLQGCWKIESALVHQVDGGTRTSPSVCFDFFDAATVTSTCISNIGVVRPPRTDQYQLPGEGRLSVSPGQFEKSAREYSYRIDGNILTRTQYLDAPNPKWGPTAGIKVITKATRIATSSTESCLPKPVTVSKENAARYWSIEALVGKTLEDEAYAWALLGFLEGYQKPFPAGSVSEENQARVLAELQKIADQSAVPLRKALSPLAPRILEIFYQPGHCSPSYIDQDLASPIKQAWVADSVQEILGSRRLAAYLPFFRIVARDRFVAEFKGEEGDQLDKHSGLGDNYRLQRELLLRFADSPWLIAVLPEGARLSPLSQLTRKNAGIAKANHFSPPNCLEREVRLTTQALRSAELKDLMNSELNRVKKLGAQLRDRFAYVVNPPTTETCFRYEPLYDPESVRQSHGDWRKVRIVGGQALTADISKLSVLPSAYASGCFGKRDTAAARRTLEVYANSHGDKGKIAARTHCQLARWYRYGIGGERDEARAREWEARFRRDTGATGGCSDDLTIIDPDDPWRRIN